MRPLHEVFIDIYTYSSTYSIVYIYIHILYYHHRSNFVSMHVVDACTFKVLLIYPKQPLFSGEGVKPPTLPKSTIDYNNLIILTTCA